MNLLKTPIGKKLFFAIAVLSSSLHAQGFTEFFEYNPGNISIASDNQWTSFGNNGPEIQIANCRCQISSPGGMDAMRPLGEPSNEDVWFYAVEVFVDGVKGLPLNDQSFIHLEDTDLDNPLACLQIEPPTEPDKDFGLSILATLDSNSKTIWNGEFNFQDRVVAVVKWDNNTGQATLWVNPLLSKDPEVDNESVTNSDPLHSMATIDNLVLRQSIGAKNTGTIITINRLVTGLNFGVLVPIAFDFLIQLGDINRDCMVNLLDVAPFVELLLNGQYDPVADFNADGVVDLLDIELFVQALTS